MIESQAGSLNPKFTKVEEEDKIEKVLTDAIMISEITKSRYRSDSADRRNHYRKNVRGRLRYEQNYRGGNFRGNTRTN